MYRNRVDLSLLLLGGASVLLFFVFAPFLAVLALAAVFAVILHRPYERLARALRGWKSLAALLTVGLTLVFFIAPLFFLGMQILKEAQGLYGAYGSGTEYVHLVERAIEGPIQQAFPGFAFDLQGFIGSALVFISNNLGSLAYRTLSVLLDTFLMLLALFFFLRDGRPLLASCMKMSPFGAAVTEEILDKMYRTIGSVVQGTLLNALIRWLCIWIAFSLFNIPNAMLWSSVGGIIGAIPGLGTPFAFVGAIAYLYLQNDPFGAAGLAVSGIAVVVLVDNVLTSYFFGKGLEVSPLFVLFSILGGIVFFGPIGFILGPLVLSVFLAVARASSLSERGKDAPA